MATYDAGIVTAYGAAVRGGYTGTYEEFCAQQANYAQNAAAVEQAKQDAQAAAQDASESAETLSESVAQIATNTQDISSLKEDFDDLDDRVTALEEGGSGSGLTDDIKQAILQISRKVAYIDAQGQTYYNALYNALYPPADLISISAVYTQSGTVYDSDTLDSLKDDLVVTARMSDKTTRTVTEYILSGTLSEGTSTVTVTYGGKFTTFNVIVTKYIPYTYYDYLEGDGVAFLDTGLLASTYLSDSYKKYIKFKTNTLAKEKTLFGVRNAWGTTGVMVQLSETGNKSLSIAFGNAWKYATVKPGTLYEVTLEHPIITLNGSTLATVSENSPTITSGALTIPLFAHVGGEAAGAGAVNTPFKGGYANQYCTHRIYQFTVTDKNTNEVVANMIPAIRNNDGAVGMYDTVRKLFATNYRDTGAFTIGNDE